MARSPAYGAREVANCRRWQARSGRGKAPGAEPEKARRLSETFSCVSGGKSRPTVIVPALPSPDSVLGATAPNQRFGMVSKRGREGAPTA